MQKNVFSSVGEGFGLILLLGKFAAVSAIIPGFQIWFMLFSRWMDWWSDPGITWLDCLMAMILPGYAIWQTLFG